MPERVKAGVYSLARHAEDIIRFSHVSFGTAYLQIITPLLDVKIRDFGFSLHFSRFGLQVAGCAYDSPQRHEGQKIRDVFHGHLLVLLSLWV